MSAFGGDDAADEDSFGLPEIRLRPLDKLSDAGEPAAPETHPSPEKVVESFGPSSTETPPVTEIPEVLTTAPQDTIEPYAVTSVEPLDNSERIIESVPVPENQPSQITETDDFPEDHDLPDSAVPAEDWNSIKEDDEPFHADSPNPEHTPPQDVYLPPPVDTDNHSQPIAPSSGPRRWLIYFLIPLVLGCAVFLTINLYLSRPPEEQEEHLKLLEEHAKPKKEKPLRKTFPESGDKPRRINSQEGNTPATPVATTTYVNSPTNRFYVIVHSSIDRDLLLDSCRKYNSEGMHCKVIPSGPQTRFNRLSLADFDNYPAAETRAVQLRPRFGPTVWVLQY